MGLPWNPERPNQSLNSYRAAPTFPGGGLIQAAQLDLVVGLLRAAGGLTSAAARPTVGFSAVSQKKLRSCSTISTCHATLAWRPKSHPLTER